MQGSSGSAAQRQLRMCTSAKCPFLKATARGVWLGNACPPMSLLMSSLKASKAHCLITSSRSRRVSTISSHPFAAAAARGVRPEIVSLAVAETPFEMWYLTISSWPFAIAWIRGEWPQWS